MENDIRNILKRNLKGKKISDIMNDVFIKPMAVALCMKTGIKNVTVTQDEKDSRKVNISVEIPYWQVEMMAKERGITFDEMKTELEKVDK